MAEVDTEPLANGTGALSEEDERMKQRPADIDADVREMERRKRVEALMSSKLFREELERVLDQQLHEGGDAPLLQRIREMVGGRLQAGSFRGPSCVLPINDIRGMEGVGYEKGEKMLRCKLAAAYRLVDLFGWTQTGISGQITARLNTAVEQVLVTPRGVLPHEVTASSLVKVDTRGAIVDQGTTNFPVDVEGFGVHGMVHAARPDLRCVLHVRAPAALAVSAMKRGLLPLCAEAALLGDIAYHRVPYGACDNEEQEKLVRALGPHAKVLVLSCAGALCCGATLEEAFYLARNVTAACDVQLRLASLPLDELVLIDEDTRRQMYVASRTPPADQAKWRAGGDEFEALMRMLDNAGFRTGYVYRHPLVKNEVPKPKNDFEVPPAVSSLGYLLEEEELYRQGLWKKGVGGKAGERTRWLNSPNVYQKVEVLETGTNDPKKITKWVDANNEEWVQDSSPQHSSTPVKIDTLQFVPKNTNPREFKKLQQQIKDNRRADKISAGPQSHILEGVTWDEAAKLVGEDAANTATGDHVVLMGAASKGIIQRGYQHNATVYSAPYARNPFDRVSDTEIADYRRVVERKQRADYDTDVSESEPLSGAQFTSPLSETEEDSRDEHRVLRIETKQVPVRSQPEIVLSDDFINAERAHADRTKVATSAPKRDPNLLPDDEVFLRSPVVSPVVTPVVSRVVTPMTSPRDVRTQHRVVRGNLRDQDSNPNKQTLEARTTNQRTKHEYSRTPNFENAIKKFSSPESRFPNVANSINLNNSTNFARVRERFNSPDSEVKKMAASSVANIDSPVYEDVREFASHSYTNIEKGVVHPKCKVSLSARLSSEGKLASGSKTVDDENLTAAKASQTSFQEKEGSEDSAFSGLAKLASELKNDATNLNSRIAIKAFHSKLANESKSEPFEQHFKSCQHSRQGSELYSYALDLYNPGNNSPRSSLYSVPSLEWDGRCRSEYAYRSRSLPRQRSKHKEQRLYRTQSHSGFVSRTKDPEPTHFHLPRCNSCGATNVSYTWELIKEDLQSIRSGRTVKAPTSIYMSVEDIPEKCSEAGRVRVTKKVVPVHKVVKLDEEFVESQEFCDDNYFGEIGTSFSSDNQTVIEKVGRFDQEDALAEETLKVIENLKEGFGNESDNNNKNVGDGLCVSVGENAQFIAVSENAEVDILRIINDAEDLHRAKLVMISKDDDKETEPETDNTLSTEGEYHSFTDEIDFDTAYVSPVKELVEKDIRDYSVPIGFYCDDYKKETSPAKSPKSPKRREVIPTSPNGNILEPILEESKSSYDDSGNLSNVDSRLSGESLGNKTKGDYKAQSLVDVSAVPRKIDEVTENVDVKSKVCSSKTDSVDVSEHAFDDTTDNDTPKMIKVDISVNKAQIEAIPKQIEVIELYKGDMKAEERLDTNKDDLLDENEDNFNVYSALSTKPDLTIDKGINEAKSVKEGTAEENAIKSMVQDIFVTAVEASHLKSELALSSTQKMTPQLLQTEYLNKDSYFIAEEDDATTNDIESVATNIVQTAIDIYSEGEEVTETDQLDILNCVYDNIFEILSEDAISTKVVLDEDSRTSLKSVTLKDDQKSKLTESAPVCETSLQKNEKEPSGNESQVLTREKEEENGEKGPNGAFVEHIPAVEGTETSFDCNATEARKSSFEYSIASSGVELKSFDSTVEFEKYEVVADIVSRILDTIDLDRSRSSCNTLKNILTSRHVITCFELGTTESERSNAPTTQVDPPCDLQDETDVLLQSVVTEPQILHSSVLQPKLDLPLDENNEEAMEGEQEADMMTIKQPENETSVHSIVLELPHEMQESICLESKADPEVTNKEIKEQELEIHEEFSIAKMIQDMELNVNLNETVLTEASETESTLAQKIGESLIYYIFDRAFCLLAEKKAFKKVAKAKKVVTVVDSEDILLTAKSLWYFDDLECEILSQVQTDLEPTNANECFEQKQNVEPQNTPLPSNQVSEIETDDMSAKVDFQTANDKSPLDDVEICLNSDNTDNAVSANLHIDDDTVDTIAPKVDDKSLYGHLSGEPNSESFTEISKEVNNNSNLNETENEVSLAVNFSTEPYVDVSVTKTEDQNSPNEDFNNYSQDSNSWNHVETEYNIDLEGLACHDDSDESFDDKTYNVDERAQTTDASIETVSEIINDMIENSILEPCEDCEHCTGAIERESSESFLNKTFVLEKRADMNTAFVIDSSDDFYKRSSSPQKEMSIFERCTESPIKNTSTSFSGDDLRVFYEKDDTILGSPFLKQAPVISMSQTVNAGGLKYWLSFDESLTESIEKPTYRSLRKYEENKLPSFVTVDFKKEDAREEIKRRSWVYDRDCFKRSSVLLDDIDLDQSKDTNMRTEDSYATASGSADYHTCESDLTESQIKSEEDNAKEPQKKLLYDSNSKIDLHARSNARHCKSWPPFEDAVFYKIISKFRLSESFDDRDFEDVKFDNSI